MLYKLLAFFFVFVMTSNFVLKRCVNLTQVSVGYVLDIFEHYRGSHSNSNGRSKAIIQMLGQRPVSPRRRQFSGQKNNRSRRFIFSETGHRSVLQSAWIGRSCH